jgi:hypothetical protein
MEDKNDVHKLLIKHLEKPKKDIHKNIHSSDLLELHKNKIDYEVIYEGRLVEFLDRYEMDIQEKNERLIDWVHDVGSLYVAKYASPRKKRSKK